MGQGSRRIRKRRRAKQAIAGIMEMPEQVIVIHYSCESFYDRPDGSSPRITSIAVRYLDSGQTTSFSIHQVAEREGYDLVSLESHYNQLERLMLDDFYDFVKTHQHFKWLHWNMRDSHFGFSAISHRYRTLKGQPIDIENSRLYDLSRLLIDIYGVDYIGHRRLENLVKRNNMTAKDFLNGEEEAVAFDSKDYVKLHFSTLRKVDVLAGIVERADNDSLQTNANWIGIYGSYPQAVFEFVQERWWIAAIVAVIAILSDIFGIIDFWPR